jgi:hypothetical protein
MKKSDVTYIVGSVFAAMTAFFYCCTRWFSINLPRYYPLEHTWKWVNEKGVASQAWYAMQVFAYLAGGAAALVVWLSLRRKAGDGFNLKPGVVRWVGMIASVIVIYCMGYIVYYEFDKWGIF